MLGILVALVGFCAAALRAQPDCVAKVRADALFSATCNVRTCTFSTAVPTGASAVWDFGDFGSAQGAPVTHDYAADGTYLVTLTMTYADGQISVERVAVNIGSASTLAVNDQFVTVKGKAITIGIDELLNNDAPGVAVSQVSSRCPLSADGLSCTYTPNFGFVGIDTFTYTVVDAACGQPGNCPDHSGTATVTIIVSQPLVANPDQFEKQPNENLFIDATQLLANDLPAPSDIPPAMFMGADLSSAVGGTLTLDHTSAQGTPIYLFVPQNPCKGTGSFQYDISLDGSRPFERGTVYVIVKDVPPTPAFTVTCTNRTCTFSSTSMDCGNVLPTHYFWNWGDGSPLFEVPWPNPWFDQTHIYATSGRFTVTHTVMDDAGQTKSLQRDVVPNTRPVAVNDWWATDRDVATRIPVLANDSDADGDTLTAAADLSQYPGANAIGTSCPPGPGICVVPPDSFVGTMVFPYTVNDPLGATATATVTLVVSQWAHVTDALGEQFYTGQNTQIRIPKATLLANDYDDNSPPNNVLSITSLDTSLLMGTLDTTTETTAYTYRPPTNAAGVTLFRYKACDGIGHCDWAIVRIYVSALGQPPIARDDYFTTPRNTAKAFTIQQVVANDSDPDGDTLTVGVGNGARDFGSLSCSTPMYTCTYTPNSGFVGTDRFIYSAWDTMNPASTAFINMLMLPPTTATFDAREDVKITGVNQQMYITFGALLLNDYDPEGDAISVSSVDSTGLNGSLTCDSFGCQYQPSWGFVGSTRFKYTASDGHGSTDVAIVKIRAGGTNGTPVAGPDTLTTPKNTVRRFSVFELLANDFDPDNDPLGVTVYPANTAKGSLACDAKTYWCTYTPVANVTGADTFTYYLSDGAAGASSTFTVNIGP